MYTLTIEGTLPADKDPNEDAGAIIAEIAADLEKSGHSVERISISHGAIRGGARTLTKTDATALAAVAVDSISSADVGTVEAANILNA